MLDRVLHVPIFVVTKLFLYGFRKSMGRTTRSVKTKPYVFFYQSFLSWTMTTHRTAGEGRAIFYSTLPLPTAHEYLDMYLQLWMSDDCLIFLIAPLVFTRLLLNEICHLIQFNYYHLIVS